MGLRVGDSQIMDRSLRVAVTLEQCWHRVPGGTATSALQSVAAVQRDGRVQQIGVSAHHRSAPDPAFAPSIEVKQLPLPRLAMYELWQQFRIGKVQRATGAVDVIHATGMAVPPKSAPLVVTVHDLHFRHEPQRFTKRGLRFFDKAIALAKKDADVVICPSPTTLAQCVADGFRQEKLRVVPWGVDAEPVSESTVAGVRARYGLDRPYVLWAGTIEPRKNLPRLLDAFSRLSVPHTLVLAGPQGWNESIERQLAALGEKVKAIGFVDQPTLRALYAGADVFAFPSLAEGFGLPIAEAMVQKTAVLTSSKTATADVAGDAAVVVDPTDVDAIASGLQELLEDDALRARFAESGYTRAITEFSLQQCADKLVSVYEEVAR
jgi:glycosyltransferase involved in cell wall biosynthesis